MSDYVTCHLTTRSALRSQAVAWDDLWRRSAVTHVTSRAALIDQWVGTFAPQCRFQAITVWHQNRMVAALPVIERRKRGWLACLDVPGNEWSSAGQFLLDPACDTQRACDRLVAGMPPRNCGAFWFASIPVEAPWWRSLSEAWRRSGWKVDVRPRYQVGQLLVPPAGRDPLSACSAGFRKKLRRSIRQLEQRGRLHLRLECPEDPDRACRLAASCWQLEHAGWKGRAATSVLADAPASGFLTQQVRQLAAWGQLQLAMLELDDRVIACEYGWRAKQTYHSYKIAYDERYARFSPGQIMVHALVRRFQDEDDIRCIDFLGPLDDAARRWRPGGYAMGRLLSVPPGPVGQLLLLATRHVLPLCTS